jgi:hypothetical protein
LSAVAQRAKAKAKPILRSAVAAVIPFNGKRGGVVSALPLWMACGMIAGRAKFEAAGNAAADEGGLP